MKKSIFLVMAIATLFGLGQVLEGGRSKPADELVKLSQVTGIGGIFFKCKDPKKVKEWYRVHLGLNTDDYGVRFEWWQGADTSKKGSTQWSPFKETTKYFEPSVKDLMINYRVTNLEVLAGQLKASGVRLTDSIETYDYGKFVHVMDEEGNKIELWEPNAEHEAKPSKPVPETGKPRRVTGIGGIFFKCKDTKKLKDWYRVHLGLKTDDYGPMFEWREAADASKKGLTQWSPFKETTTYFSPSTKDFMINYRVANLEVLVGQLKAEGVVITDSIETYDYGKFVHLMDEEGNKIELWEPLEQHLDTKDHRGKTK